ncbi:MAG: Holliday junction branch migration protein RuvA [Atribacterota bacterium]
MPYAVLSGYQFLRPMFEYIKGIIIAIENEDVMVESGLFGFRVKVTPFVPSLQVGNEKKLLLRFFLKENGEFVYYGFEDSGERQYFDLLRDTKGIGPRTAFKILSRVCWKELYELICAENVDFLVSRTNLGSKTIKRILLELKPRIIKGDGTLPSPRLTQSQSWQEVRSALTALGYSTSEVDEKLNELWKENRGTDPSTESLLKQALKKMSGRE